MPNFSHDYFEVNLTNIFFQIFFKEMFTALFWKFIKEGVSQRQSEESRGTKKNILKIFLDSTVDILLFLFFHTVFIIEIFIMYL